MAPKRKKCDTKSDQNTEDDEKGSEEKPITTFKDLGLIDELCAACARLKWLEPTKIQREAIPPALQGKDVVGLAETGSGKTAAFALPVLQALLEKPQNLFALILTPTRELADQILKQFEALGSKFSLKCAALVGGVDREKQERVLWQKPHVLIATPGRMLDHLENTKGFSLQSLKYLVIDEADRMLQRDFEIEIDKILNILPKERKTLLFSATMNTKVTELQRVHLRDPVKVEASVLYQTVDTLQQYYIFMQARHKDTYLAYVINLFYVANKSVMVFCSTREIVEKTELFLNGFGTFVVDRLHGKMSQNSRSEVFKKFRSKTNSILITTDVASRGLDVPHVDAVINFDVPIVAGYLHRVGRTARAGRSGKAITFVTPDEVTKYKEIERAIGLELPLFKTHEEDVAAFHRNRVKSVKEKVEMEERRRKELSDGKRNNVRKKKRKF